MYITGYTLNVKEKLKDPIIAYQEVGQTVSRNGLGMLPDVTPKVAMACLICLRGQRHCWFNINKRICQK